jgi:hypothetical protein
VAGDVHAVGVDRELDGELVDERRDEADVVDVFTRGTAAARAPVPHAPGGERPAPTDGDPVGVDDEEPVRLRDLVEAAVALELDPRPGTAVQGHEQRHWHRRQ